MIALVLNLLVGFLIGSKKQGIIIIIIIIITITLLIIRNKQGIVVGRFNLLFLDSHLKTALKAKKKNNLFFMDRGKKPNYQHQ